MPVHTDRHGRWPTHRRRAHDRRSGGARGVALAGKASPREQALIGALATPLPAAIRRPPRAPFDKAYAAEMAKVAAQFSDDDEIATLYAEAVMDLSPWNYWKPGGREPNPQSVPIVPTLERVLARNPNHPGAISLLHPCRGGVGPAEARRALCRPVARGDPRCRPSRAHASHIYYRVGPLSRRAGRQQDRGQGRMKNTWPTPTRRWASIGSAIIRITCTS